MDNLKPCPFCGFTNCTLEQNAATYTYEICCEHCGAALCRGSKNAAIQAWNTRKLMESVMQSIKVALADIIKT